MTDDTRTRRAGSPPRPRGAQGSGPRWARGRYPFVPWLPLILGVWGVPAWAADAPATPRDLACPRFGPRLVPPAPPPALPGTSRPEEADRAEQENRWQRGRDERTIRENLLASERERGLQGGSPFDRDDRAARADPGPIHSPIGAIETALPTFFWTPLEGAAGYWLRVERSDGWSLLEAAPGPPFTPSRPLAPGWRYRWLYRGWNEEAGMGPWCAGGVFDLGTDRPRSPEPLEPRGRQAGRLQRSHPVPAPIFRWSPVPGARRYHFLLRGSRGDLVHEAWVDGTTLVLPFGLEAGERYSWQVAAWDPAGGLGWPSAEEAFETPDPPLVPPTPLEPTGTASRNPPTFAWGRVPGAALYRLQVLEGEETLLVDHWTRETEFTPPRPFAAPRTYRWRVRPWNGWEGEGEASPETAFRVAPDPR